MKRHIIYIFILNIFREEGGDLLEQPDVIFAEGILTFYFKEIRDMFHMKLFVDTDADTRLARRGNSIIFMVLFFKIFFHAK